MENFTEFMGDSEGLSHRLAWGTMFDRIRDQLMRHEGLRLKPYKCSQGKLTIGIGRNLEEKGISMAEAALLLDNDIFECLEDLKEIFSMFEAFPENVKLVLTDMRFNLGPLGFRKFKRMIAAVKLNDWQEAAKEMKDSAWYRQVGNRARILIEMMENVLLIEPVV